MATKSILISKNLTRIAKDINKKLEECSQEKQPFCLFVFAEKTGEFSQYISNAPRESIKKCLEETLKAWDKEETHIAAHDKH